VSAADVRANLLRVMWKLEALRRQLDLRDFVIHDAPLLVTSGFRGHACQLIVSAAHPSQHEYGTAADLVSDAYSLCTIARQARFAGFGTVLGPGYPDHDDHIHVDMADENMQDEGDAPVAHIAPDCFLV
jgi:zinc D-Ala-D-Ala carboxypeptidase